MVYAYLRVSTLDQDEHNQRLGVESKAQELGVTINKFVVDRVSGTKEPDKRNLGKVLRRANDGDVIICSELSRLSRRIFSLFSILEQLLNRGVHVYSVKDGYNLDNSIQSKVIAFAFGMAAEIERDMISMRTREALQLRKLQGVKLGRPFGAKTKNHKLDRYRPKIESMYRAGVSKRRIAKKCHVCDKTILRYMRRYNICQ